MPDMNPPAGLYADYLRLLGLRPRVPSLEALTELTGAHLVRVPFENVSKLYYLYRLLENLGYRVRLCGADMSRPDVHLVIVVTVEGHEYVVDGGYGAPFLAPLPRD